MSKKVEYYRIAEGKYQEEGQVVVLRGLTGYNLERDYNPNTGFGNPTKPERFIGVFEKAAKKADKVKITRLKDKNNKASNKYQITLKNNGETDTAVIKITNEIAKKHPEYAVKMNCIAAANVSYRKTNTSKKVAKGFKTATKKAGKALAYGVVTVGAGAILAFAVGYGLEKEAEAYNKRQQQYIEEIKMIEQQQLDEICSSEPAYSNDERCIERRGGIEQVMEDRLEAEEYEKTGKTR